MCLNICVSALQHMHCKICDWQEKHVSDESDRRLLQILFCECSILIAIWVMETLMKTSMKRNWAKLAQPRHLQGE